MRSRVLSLWLPNLATDRIAPRIRSRNGQNRPETTGPIATFAAERGAQRLAAVCPLAARAGLRVGMMLTDARAMLPRLAVYPTAPAADAELLERLAAWCERYTPYVAIDRTQDCSGGALWLDITGCAHLFGGEAALRRDLLAHLERRGFAARAAIADSPGAAWALARFGADEAAIVQPGGSRAALGPLPVAALRLAPEEARMLERLGLARIEILYPLPRQALVARFGDNLTTRLDQALGAAEEPISPRTPLPAHRAQLGFVEPILQREALLPVTKKLLQPLCCGLEAASCGARRLVLAFYRVDNSTDGVAIGTSRPCRDPRQLARLLEEKLERIDPGFGIERAVLEAAVVEPLLPEPLAWRAMGAGDLDQVRDLAPGPVGERGPNPFPALAPLVDRLSNRLGSQAVVQLVPHASHVPERAQRKTAPFSLARSRPEAQAAQALVAAPARPLRLLARPEPIEAMAPLPDDPPVLFRWRRALHKVARVRGPERLAPEWWRDPDVGQDAATRDYFAVEDTQGGRFWLFREGLYLAEAAMPRWYLHGLFA
ncbi:MAG TPA: DNA polymerase Y family protein [Geminicoccaceae bacterium]|nr:DNA polymerase Y family protein [Geminicoccaceae bacterium]